VLSSRQLYAVIRADLLISNALFELAYVFVYVSCHIFVINAHDCLPPYIQILATPWVCLLYGGIVVQDIKCKFMILPVIWSCGVSNMRSC